MWEGIESRIVMGNKCEDKMTLRAAAPAIRAAERKYSEREELAQSTPNTRFKETKPTAMLRGMWLKSGTAMRHQ